MVVCQLLEQESIDTLYLALLESSMSGPYSDVCTNDFEKLCESENEFFVPTIDYTLPSEVKKEGESSMSGPYSDVCTNEFLEIKEMIDASVKYLRRTIEVEDEIHSMGGPYPLWTNDLWENRIDPEIVEGTEGSISWPYSDVCTMELKGWVGMITLPTIDYTFFSEVKKEGESSMSGPYSDVCTNEVEKLWKNGIVPYMFDDNVSLELKKSVLEAMGRISSVGLIEFVKRKNQKDYIKLVEKGGYWSYVGKQGGEQELSVAKGWRHPIGSAMHELMHAIGFYHEHCRPDRDQYVTVKINNINYKMLDPSYVRCFGPYDKESIMHYHLCSGMYLKPGEVDPGIGQRIKLSEGDIRALRKLYSFRNARADTDLSVSNPSIITETEEAEFDSSKTKKKKNANTLVTILICILFVLISV